MTREIELVMFNPEDPEDESNSQTLYVEDEASNTITISGFYGSTTHTVGDKDTKLVMRLAGLSTTNPEAAPKAKAAPKEEEAPKEAPVEEKNAKK